MYPHVVYAFIDGGYLRALARERNVPLSNPRALAFGVLDSTQIQTWAFSPMNHPNAVLGRITYYDALPDPPTTTQGLEDYWRAIEVLDDVHLGFGVLKGLKRKARQKGVDAQVAVDMLVGAFSGLFDIAVLVAGDADFVPVLEEVKRRGVDFPAATDAGDPCGRIRVHDYGACHGHAEFLRRAGADEGDILQVSFDLATGRANLALIDDESLDEMSPTL